MYKTSNWRDVAELFTQHLGGLRIDKYTTDLSANTQFDSIHRSWPLQKLDTEGFAAGDSGQSLGDRLGRADQIAARVGALNEPILIVIGGLGITLDLLPPLFAAFCEAGRELPAQEKVAVHKARSIKMPRWIKVAGLSAIALAGGYAAGEHCQAERGTDQKRKYEILAHLLNYPVTSKGNAGNMNLA
jgi:hypothetical protein